MTWYMWVWGVCSSIACLVAAGVGLVGLIEITESRKNRRKAGTLRCERDDAMREARQWKTEYEALMELHLKTKQCALNLEKK